MDINKIKEQQYGSVLSFGNPLVFPDLVDKAGSGKTFQYRVNDNPAAIRYYFFCPCYLFHRIVTAFNKYVRHYQVYQLQGVYPLQK